MRQAGYAFDRQEGEELSFARRISGDYPRFHAYVSQMSNVSAQGGSPPKADAPREHASGGNDQMLIINLHLDQKRPSYGTARAHSGEYDSPLVANEGQRIKSFHR